MLWFLDWSLGSFIVIVAIIIFSSLVYMLDNYFKGTLNEKKASIVRLFFIFLMFLTIKTKELLACIRKNIILC